MNCPLCSGETYDNRQKNKERVAAGQRPMPDFACKDKDGCGWVKWPPKDAAKAPPAGEPAASHAPKNSTDAGALMTECVAEGIARTKQIAMGLAGAQAEDPLVVAALIEAAKAIGVTLFIQRARE